MDAWRVVIFLGAALAGAAGVPSSPAADAPMMSEHVSRRLTAASAVIEAGDHAAGDTALAALARDTGLSRYEQGHVWQAIGRLRVRQSRPDEAIEAFERALEQRALGPHMQAGALHALVGLYARLERWQDAVATVERWLERAPTPPLEAAALIAGAYAEARQYRRALPWLDRAIAAAPAPVREQHHLRFVLLYELGEHREAERAARTLVRHWPDAREHWAFLQAAQRAAGDEAAALAAMQLAYRHGSLRDGERLVDLARLLLYLDLPYDAGELLERELAAGRVGATPANRALVVSAWESARAYDRALTALDELAAVSDDAQALVRKAQLLVDRRRFAEAIEAAANALAQPLSTRAQRGTARLLAGVAHLELGDRAAARAAFAAAAEHGGHGGVQAREWLAYLDAEP